MLVDEATDSQGGAQGDQVTSPQGQDAEHQTEELPEEQSFNDLPEDDKLKQCFLYAMKKKLKKTQLPLLTSEFYRDCVVSCW